MSDLKFINNIRQVTETGKAVNISLSYQIFGQELHAAPIVLVNHALTGNSNICGINGWWKDLIGKGKCLNTDVYTILAFNIPGNGYDENPENLIDNYKDFTARDIAKIFAIGLNELSINSLYAVLGGSVGGGIAWELAALKPKLIEYLIPIAADWKSTDWLIANCHIQESILNNSTQPLADARMHAMTLYRTPESFTQKFNRTEKKENQLFNVESWLNYHGDILNKRFELAAYKMMNQILRTIDITQGKSNFLKVASKIESNIKIITINSDLFFKSEENWKTYEELKSINKNVSIGTINSIHGHDAFLIEFDQLSNLLFTIFKQNVSSKAS
ncbi:MAG: alpha/beta fold hydrolase [Bacteroidia bacterium]|nr:alpha/beta fold hydrolase [Bacteroidia bacterium]MBT8279038.1 alpha/beta fold hydrolase [Bacteroidia bacterium]NNK59938.1 alpha/beta fold hydrolase [Flavobacteriaceae bacterium]NNL33109.1 alpha/beta fold hydrolase [Flavobacteriaceae bacterium]RZW45001.1 MAG: alpha/beta fold hydrolase [Flavobacteriaceae bacterium]